MSRNLGCAVLSKFITSDGCQMRVGLSLRMTTKASWKDVSEALRMKSDLGLETTSCLPLQCSW